MTRPLMLDTCALLWLGGSSERFSADTVEAIETAAFLYASPISLWEIAFKVKLGKLHLELSPEE